KTDRAPIALRLLPPTLPVAVLWSTHAAAPLPRDWEVMSVDDFALYEDGKRIAAQIESVGTWSPRGEIKWLHVWANFQFGSQPPRYELRPIATTQKPPVTSLKIVEQPEGW